MTLKHMLSMDPQELFQEIIERMADGYAGVDVCAHEDCPEMLRKLADYIEKGGFFPNVEAACRLYFP